MKFVSSTLERKNRDQPCPWRGHLLHCSAGIPQHQPWREISKWVKTSQWHLPISRPWSTMSLIRQYWQWPTHPVVASSEMQRGAVSTWEFNSISIITGLPANGQNKLGFAENHLFPLKSGGNGSFFQIKIWKLRLASQDSLKTRVTFCQLEPSGFQQKS